MRQWDCTPFDNGRYLSAQLNMKCFGPNRRMWEKFAWLMVAIYPVGVPLLFLTVLFSIRKKIEETMGPIEEELKKEKKEDEEFEEKNKLRPSKARRRSHLDPDKIVERELSTRDTNDTSDKNLLPRVTAHLYKKYESKAWWFGVFTLMIRLFQTSFLVSVLLLVVALREHIIPEPLTAGKCPFWVGFFRGHQVQDMLCDVCLAGITGGCARGRTVAQR